MNYTIEHETSTSLRMHLPLRKLTQPQSDGIERALYQVESVKAVRTYRGTGGVQVRFQGDRQAVLAALDALDLHALPTEHEMQRCCQDKMDPACRRRLRKKIIAESCFDILLPEPIQVAYHICQLAKLRNV